jgi:hypothetical protein
LTLCNEFKKKMVFALARIWSVAYREHRRRRERTAAKRVSKRLRDLSLPEAYLLVRFFQRPGRASVSLARLRRDEGRHAEARDVLAPVYGWFNEGFETPDLKEAKALLAVEPDCPSLVRPMVRRLTAGGERIRTFGSAMRSWAMVSWCSPAVRRWNRPAGEGDGFELLVFGARRD